jgi:hypothetical protein
MLSRCVVDSTDIKSLCVWTQLNSFYCIELLVLMYLRSSPGHNWFVTHTEEEMCIIWIHKTQLKLIMLLNIVSVINRNKYVCVCVCVCVCARARVCVWGGGGDRCSTITLQILFKYFTLLFQSCHSIIVSQGMSMWIHFTLNYVNELNLEFSRTYCASW